MKMKMKMRGQKMKLIELFKKKQEFEYPNTFYLIKFSDTAFEMGVRDDSNKIIEVYSYDSMGNLQIKKYRYSPERVHSLRKVYGIPGYDKTGDELTFPIVGKIELGVVKFKSR